MYGYEYRSSSVCADLDDPKRIENPIVTHIRQQTGISNRRVTITTVNRCIHWWVRLATSDSKLNAGIIHVAFRHLCNSPQRETSRTMPLQNKSVITWGMDGWTRMQASFFGPISSEFEVTLECPAKSDLCPPP